MIQSIEGIYQDGQIRTMKSIPMKNGTQVLIVFSDSYDQFDESDKNLAAISLTSSTPLEEPRLEDIDVSIKTKAEYEHVLSESYSDGESNSESTFFDSEPVDIGYTNAKMLDGIIGGVNE